MIRSLDMDAFKKAVKIILKISENLEVVYLKDLGYSECALRYYRFKNDFSFRQFLDVMGLANVIEFYDENDIIIEHNCEILESKDPFLDFDGDILFTIPLDKNKDSLYELCDRETDQYDYGKTTRDFINKKMSGRGKKKRRY